MRFTVQQLQALLLLQLLPAWVFTTGETVLTRAEAAGSNVFGVTHAHVGLSLPQSPPCHARCHLHGNCHPDGTCYCPFGYAGPACDVPLLPACRLHDTPTALMSCEQSQLPKSCACMQQCAHLYCTDSVALVRAAISSSNSSGIIESSSVRQVLSNSSATLEVSFRSAQGSLSRTSQMVDHLLSAGATKVRARSKSRPGATDLGCVRFQAPNRLCYQRLGITPELEISDVPGPQEAVAWLTGGRSVLQGRPVAWSDVLLVTIHGRVHEVLPQAACLHNTERRKRSSRNGRQVTAEAAAVHESKPGGTAKHVEGSTQRMLFSGGGPFFVNPIQVEVAEPASLVGCGGVGRCLRLAAADRQRFVSVATNKTGRVSFCECWPGYTGQHCEIALDNVGAHACPLNCMGRGRCVYGFCHCQPGFYGTACASSLQPTSQASLSTAAELSSRTATSGAQATRSCQQLFSGGPSATLQLPRIYIYDLPTYVAWQPVLPLNSIYSGGTMFFERLLQDTAVRTHDPHTADLFFLPASLDFHTGSIASTGGWRQAMRVVNYIQATHPWWNRTNGADHVMWTSNDIGAAAWGNMPMLQHLIKVAHYGYHSRRAIGESRADANARQWYRHRWPGFAPLRDVVAVPHDHSNAFFDKASAYFRGDMQEWVASKRRLLFFAGSFVWNRDLNDLTYSLGARQAMSTLFVNHSDPRVLVTNRRLGSNYLQEVATSMFCIAPAGLGWGIRLVTYALHGCIPVIVQDHVAQPFEDLLPYADFSMRVMTRGLPNLISLLDGIGAEKREAMYVALRRTAPAFLWYAEQGTAYEHTLCSLAMRTSRLPNATAPD